MTTQQKTQKKHYRLLCNDDGWIMGAYGPPLTPDLMRENMIASYEGSPVDVFLWSVGGHDVYDYETEVGERYGEGYENLDEKEGRKRDNLRQLIRDHGGPVTVIARLCHEAGMAFFPSVRMNEHYDMDPSSVSYSRLRREHPDLLIGRPGEALPEGSLEWGIRTGLNYAFAEVRSYMARIIFELIERFDVDGIELDFMRHPAFFRIEEAYPNRYLATDLVRAVRKKLEEAGHKRGRHLDLAVRVPPTLADSVRIGLDVEVWIREGLVDVVIAGGGFVPFEMPIGQFVEAANGTGCRIYGCFEALRSLLDEDMLAALASRYWNAGVDGLYLFNYFSLSNQWKRDVLGRLADPAVLARIDKCYEVDHGDRSGKTSQLGCSFLNAIPAAQLLAVLAPTLADRGVVLRIDIADDLAAARAGGGLDKCVLGLGFEKRAGEAELEVRLNGAVIVWNSGRTRSNTWTRLQYDNEWGHHPSRTKPANVPGDQIDFDLDGSVLRQGVNELEVRLVGTDAPGREPLVLKDVRVWIGYGSS